MNHIWSDDYFSLSSQGGIVRATRSEEPFPSLEVMETCLEALNGALDRAGRSEARFLVDTRAAPPRNDTGFEEAFAPHRQRMLSGWERCAVLVTSEVGRLQVKRHAKADRVPLRVFKDEGEALEWLGG